VGELNYSGIAYDQYTFGYRLETREGALAYFFRGRKRAEKNPQPSGGNTPLYI
jgi:hypothetical protein